MAVVTAQEMAALVAEDQRKLNNGRRLPVTLDRIRMLMQEESFPICNVGPWPYHCERGSLIVDIPAYDPKKDKAKAGCAMSAPQPSIRREAKIIDEHEFGWIEDDGHMVARELVGVGFGLHPMNSLVQYGVFVPDGALPTPEEIAAAKGQLLAYRNRLIEEARDAYDKGPEERKAVISDKHLWAAREAGIDEKWVHHQHTQESVRCDMCGKYNPSGVAKCQCGTILDFELYRKIEARQQEQLLELQTRPVSPPLKK